MVDRLIERARKKIEDIKGRISFGEPKTVGSALVKAVTPDEFREGCDLVSLDIPDSPDLPLVVFGVPHDQFKAGNRAELIVRKEKTPLPKIAIGTSFLERAKRAVYTPSNLNFGIAIRPFNPQVYGQITKKDWGSLQPMFGQNPMDLSSHDKFSERFMK